MNELNNNISKWIENENKIEMNKEKLKLLIDVQNAISDLIIEKLNTIQLNYVKISDGHLQIETVKKPTTYSIAKLQKCLDEYFDDDTNNAEKCLHYIKTQLTNHEETIVLKRYKK